MTRDRRFTFWLLLCLLMAMLLSSAYSDHHGDFHSILSKEQEKTKEPVITWHGYAEMQKDRWRNGGIVFVSGRGCRPCEHVKKKVFSDPRVIVELSTYPMVHTTPRRWRDMLPNKGYPINGVPYKGPIKGVPFLIFVKPGGTVSSRAQCPMSAKQFLVLVKSQGRKIKR